MGKPISFLYVCVCIVLMQKVIKIRASSKNRQIILFSESYRRTSGKVKVDYRQEITWFFIDPVN